MKLQTVLVSSAALLLAAVPALAEEPARAVAQPIEAFEDVLVTAGLYDPEDDEEDSYDMEGVAKKDDKKSDKKKSKKSNKKRSDKKKSDKKKSDKKKKRKSRSRNRRRKSRSYYRRYKKGTCRNPKGRRERDVCDEIEDRFCSGRQFKQNRQFCRDLGFKRSVTDEEWALIDTEEFLPEEYGMLIDDVAEDIDDSSMDSEDEDEDSYDSYDDEEDSFDSEDSGDEDLELEEKGKGKGGGNKKGGSKKNNKKKNKKKKSSKKKKSKKSNKKSKKSNKRNKRSSRSSRSSSSRSSRSCFDRSSRSSCEDKRACEWFKTSSGGFCIEASSSDYDFAEE